MNTKEIEKEYFSCNKEIYIAFPRTNPFNNKLWQEYAKQGDEYSEEVQLLTCDYIDLVNMEYEAGYVEYPYSHW
jgi:hypothetical protein